MESTPYLTVCTQARVVTLQPCRYISTIIGMLKWTNFWPIIFCGNHFQFIDTHSKNSTVYEKDIMLFPLGRKD